MLYTHIQVSIHGGFEKTKSSQDWNNVVLVHCEKLKVVIDQAMSNDNDTKETQDNLSVE